MGKRKASKTVDELYAEMQAIREKLNKLVEEQEEIEQVESQEVEEKENIQENDESASSHGDDETMLEEVMEVKADEEITKETNEEDKENELPAETPVDSEILEALGDDPSQPKTSKIKLHSSIESRWKYWFENGLSEKDKEELLNKYPTLEALQVPILNPEISAKLQENSLKRDQHIVERQQLAGSTLAIVGSIINDILEETEGMEKAVLIGKLNDAAKLINHLIYEQSQSRKAFILPGVDKKYKPALEKAKTDHYLFGKNLTERIKETNIIDKIGDNLKSQNAGQKPLSNSNRGGLNSRGLQPMRPAFAQARNSNQPALNRSRLVFRNRPYQQQSNNQRGRGRPQARGQK